MEIIQSSRPTARIAVSSRRLMWWASIFLRWPSMGQRRARCHWRKLDKRHSLLVGVLAKVSLAVPPPCRAVAARALVALPSFPRALFFSEGLGFMSTGRSRGAPARRRFSADDNERRRRRQLPRSSPEASRSRASLRAPRRPCRRTRTLLRRWCVAMQCPNIPQGY